MVVDCSGMSFSYLRILVKHLGRIDNSNCWSMSAEEIFNIIMVKSGLGIGGIAMAVIGVIKLGHH